MKKMIDLSVFNGWAKSAILMDGLDFMVTNAYVMSVLAVGLIIVFFMKNTTQITENFTFSKKYAIITGILLMLSIFQMSNVADFLYFQF